MKAELPRLLIVGPGSGAGKTTLTCALLLALKQRGKPAAFKCGPDYIDPLFHRHALGIDSCNLDVVLSGEHAVPYLLARYGQGCDLAVIEGVMGLYDGQGTSGYGSSNHIAALTSCPEVLVLSPQGQSLSMVAQISGYLHFAPNHIQGLIFNQCSPQAYPFYRELVEKHLGLKVYGFLPPLPEAAFASRKLGLICPQELPDLQNKLRILTEACLKHVDLEGLLALARSAPALEYTDLREKPMADVTIAVAEDKAFCFSYRDNFELLQELGAKLVFFSPLTDQNLPQDIAGLILGGGYPEEHAATLNANQSMIHSIRRTVEAGMPVLAEGGGFLYLCRSLRDRQGQEHAMAALINAQAMTTERLARFGYITLDAMRGNFLCPHGTRLTAHEFHYSDSNDNGAAFHAVKANGQAWPCVHASPLGDKKHIFAGYPHFHFRGNPTLARAFVAACQKHKERG